ncbi:hypothetical protein HPB47_008664 [Ixodes persulcatus]|uniref:Uncharacterized protein n=1 Tax=Ixodes persulcatus TaxID=34615 RepID=A0AC60P4K9_IXOPE|nr:hypothetical protein HPB47_008664 [Ixodes persulcatus]
MIRTTRRGADFRARLGRLGGQETETYGVARAVPPSSLSLFLPSLSLFLRERVGCCGASALGGSARRRAAKCGFSSPAMTASPEPEEPPAIEEWDQLGVECSSHDFITVDDDLATCGTRTIEDIVDEMKEPEQQSDSDGEDCGGSEEAPSTSETLHALDVLRRPVSLGTVSEETSVKFYALQKGLLCDMEV